MPSPTGVYTASESRASVTTARVLIELTVPSNVVAVIKRVWVTNEDNDTNEQGRIELTTHTAAGSGGTALTEHVLSGSGSSAAGVTAVGNVTTAGAGEVVIWTEGFALLNGWLWVPGSPEEEIVVDAASPTVFGVKLDTTITSSTLSSGITWAEYGA